MTPTALPEPIDQRWRPLRIGLVDLFYYDIEEFHFHGGCLLLRGNNGTGKSKVLALTLPFLLDGELAAHRVEPDGDKNKRMEWNLLLGGKHPHAERLGYTWMEFGRRDADGNTSFVTIGCGLKAVAGKGIARHWYFVTDQRIGPELSLLNATRTALGRDRLKDAIGPRGIIYDRAVDYRRAVDEALFGLGSRYDALVSLLIQLRQPQLSKRPDERLLSQALTEALPPLDENLITQVAEAFRSLDDERTTLLGLQEANKAADDFLGVYRRYATVAAKRKAAGPRQAQSRYEQIGRDLGEQERAYASAAAELAAAETMIAELAEIRAALQTRREALQDSPEMRAAKDLDAAESLARDRESLARNRKQFLDDAVAAEQGLVRKAAKAADDHGAAEAAREIAHGRVTAAAHDALIGGDHADRVDAAVSAELPPYQQSKAAAEALAGWRGQSVAKLQELLDLVREAQRTSHRTREDAELLAGAVADARARILEAEDLVTTVAAQLVADLHRCLAASVELRVADLDDVMAAFDAWVQILDGPNPAAAAMTTAMTDATAALAHAGAELTASRRAVSEQLAAIEVELRRLASGGHDAPAVPYTRSGDARRGPGAPLWKVVDFVDGLSEPDRAGVEAALEVAGLLDAWLMPDGSVLDAQTGDVLLTEPAPVPVNISRVLRPALDPEDAQAAALSPATVSVVLAGIGFGADTGATTWIDADGRFANGVLRGRWHKNLAIHIGEGAREAARRARIAELTGDRTALDADLGQLDERIAQIAARRVVLAAEQRACPTDADLRDRHAELRERHAAARTVAAQHRDAVQRAELAQAEELAAADQAQEFADDVRLPIVAADLRTVDDAVNRYRTALAGWWPACAEVVAAGRRVAEARREHELSAANIRPAQADHAEADLQARAARERHTALQEASGTTVAELQRQLADVAAQITQAAADAQRAQKSSDTAREARGLAEGLRQQLGSNLTSSGVDRDAQVEELRQFAATGLLALACPEVELLDPAQPWPATPAVVLARAIDRALDDVDDSDRRWELAQERVSTGSKILTDVLAQHNHSAALSVRDEVMIVEVTFQGRTQPIAGLAAALATEVDERQRILSAHEREVLENHLVSEVAGTLQELISAAEQQVATMNSELDRRPTSTGMRLRLVWRTGRDAPAGLVELRQRQLRQSTDVWNEEDRSKVGAFLQQQINNERLRDDAGTWIEQLTRALDYRSWHDFAIQRHQDGQWRPATVPPPAVNACWPPAFRCSPRPRPTTAPPIPTHRV